jgi:hypothetical protein
MAYPVHTQDARRTTYPPINSSVSSSLASPHCKNSNSNSNSIPMTKMTHCPPKAKERYNTYIFTAVAEG